MRVGDLAGRVVGVAEADRVAGGVLGHAEDRELVDERLAGIGDAADAGPADHRRVHAGAADLLADPFDHEAVEALERQARDQGFRQFQEALVGRGEVGRLGALDHHELLVGVLDQRDAVGDRGMLDRDPGQRRQDLGVAARAQAMDVRSPHLLAQADRDQLGEPALDRAIEAGVGLDPVDAEDGVGRGGVLVEPAGDAVQGGAILDRLHGRAHRRADRVASVTPRWASTPAWPSAVAPPWLPIAGTMKGSKPRCFRCRTAAATTFGMWAMPRLPTATATLDPRRRSSSRRERASASSTAAARSATGSFLGWSRRTRSIGGSGTLARWGRSTTGKVGLSILRASQGLSRHLAIPSTGVGSATA